MKKFRKVVVATQHYPPDPSSTAAIMAAISTQLASENRVLVLSGTLGSNRTNSNESCQLSISEITNWHPGKSALVKRAIAELCFTTRIFFTLLVKLRRGDVALTVTAPFMLPYAVTAAAQLRRARSVLIMHDLYPDVLVMAGLLKPKAILAKTIHFANSLMFRILDVVVIIGRDTQPLLLRYKGMSPGKVLYIPNWATLAPGVRPIRPQNPYRCMHDKQFVVGLSGNLGFTHDPVVVFEAARLLVDESDIHFILSGWGIGFDQLRTLQLESNLPNVTLIERVRDQDLEEFLSAANIWLIPYRKDVAGVSVPSRFYNLLSIGRPVILVSEPEAEAALTVLENGIGWIVTPGNALELARAIREASLSHDPLIAERATQVAERFSRSNAMASYTQLVRELLRKTR